MRAICAFLIATQWSFYFQHHLKCIEYAIAILTVNDLRDRINKSLKSLCNKSGIVRSILQLMVQ